LGAVIGAASLPFAAPWLEPQLFHTRLIEPVVAGLLVVVPLGAAMLAALGLRGGRGRRIRWRCCRMEVLRAQ
jgi:hypothetical protein